MKTIIIPVEFVEKRKLKTKEFEIFIVPNKFNFNYAQYAEKQGKVLRLSKKLSTAATPEEKIRIEKELTSMGLENILDMKYDLVKSIMIANDYEFDLEWWDTRVDPSSIENFIVKCVQKDTLPTRKKKELLALVQGN